MTRLYTLAEAAARFGYATPEGALAQIRTGRLRAEKHGRDWFVTEEALKEFTRPARGRRVKDIEKGPVRKSRAKAAKVAESEKQNELN